MGIESGNIIFIIWRESVEALLVVGILNAWLSQQTDTAAARRGKLFLWSGVAAGMLLAALFGAILVGFSALLPPDAQQVFQTAAVLIAAVLIVQMVFWMRRHGRTLKRDMEASLTAAAARAQWWSVFLLAAVAVAREGSETVIFLYGTLSAAQAGSWAKTVAAIGTGALLAGASYALLQAGGSFLSWRLFFGITEAMLLLLGAALLMTGIDNLIGLDILPVLPGRLWDTSLYLPDHSRLGSIVSALTGYRARPDLTEIGAFVLYWGVIGWMLLRSRPRPKPV